MFFSSSLLALFVLALFKMVWTPTQRVRLAIEKESLEKYFLNGVTWIDPTEETKVEVRLKSNAEYEYTLRIYIPADFPNSCPKLVIVSPTNLCLKNGNPIPELSDSFHTLNKVDGFQSICHFYPPDWTADNTLYQVFMKGRLWIEAYEAHLETGKKMDVYLGHQKFTPDPNNPWMEGEERDDLIFSDHSEDFSEDEYFGFNDADDEDDDVLPPMQRETRTNPPLSSAPFSESPYTPTTNPPLSSPFSESPYSALPPFPTRTTNETSSLPGRFIPPGCVDVFSAFREKSSSMERGKPPPVKPKPPPVKPKPRRSAP